MKYILFILFSFGFFQSYSQNHSSKDFQGNSVQHVTTATVAASGCAQNMASSADVAPPPARLRALKAGMQFPANIKNISNITWAGWLWIVFRIALGLIVFFGLYIYFTKRKSRITKRLSARWVKLLNVHSKANS